MRQLGETARRLIVCVVVAQRCSCEYLVNMVMKVSCLSISHWREGKKREKTAAKKQNKRMCKKHSFYQGTFDFFVKTAKINRG